MPRGSLSDFFFPVNICCTIYVELFQVYMLITVSDIDIPEDCLESFEKTGLCYSLSSNIQKMGNSNLLLLWDKITVENKFGTTRTKLHVGHELT